MKKIFLALVLLILVTHARAADAEAPEHADRIVRITQYFTRAERAAAGSDGRSGTGWFCGSSKYLVTIGHMVTKPALPRREWVEIEISHCSDGTMETLKTHRVMVRLADLIDTPGEDIAVIELQKPLFDVKPIPVSKDMPTAKSPSYCSGFTEGTLRHASGTFHRIGKDEDSPELNDFGLFEMYEGNDRLALDHGASGAPVLNTKGEVVAVLAIVKTGEVKMINGVEPMRVSTSWGTPNQAATMIPKQLIQLSK
jgi:hypothetical protein